MFPRKHFEIPSSTYPLYPFPSNPFLLISLEDKTARKLHAF